MPAIKYTDRLLIRQIASRTGLTVSSVYKILSGASGFSQSTRERVACRPCPPPAYLRSAC